MSEPTMKEIEICMKEMDLLFPSDCILGIPYKHLESLAKKLSIRAARWHLKEVAGLEAKHNFLTNSLYDNIEEKAKEIERLRGELILLLQYCDGDICYNAQDISNIRFMVKQALNQKPDTKQ